MTDNRTTEPTTTKHLRALLDGQGVEWKSGRTNENVTSWNVGDLRVTAKELSDGTLLIQQYSRKHFTPDQAIAATLGNGTLTAEQVREAIEKRFDFDVWVPAERWQAIADELNAELGSGTCEIVAQTWEDRGGDEEDTYKYELSCGHAVRMLDCEPLHNCPRCGKAVKQ